MTRVEINQKIKEAYNDFYEGLDLEVEQSYINEQIQSAIDTTTEDEFEGETPKDVYEYFIGELNLYKSEIIENLK